MVNFHETSDIARGWSSQFFIPPENGGLYEKIGQKWVLKKYQK